MLGSSAASMAMVNAIDPAACPEKAPPGIEDRFGSRVFERFL